jgi:D-aminoacyl-tRNA deacylase
MRAVVQRVTRAEVSVDGELIGRIGPGYLVLLGVAADDVRQDVVSTASKIVGLRVFEDDAGKMNRSLADVGGGMLVVSQFTLLGDCRTGRRPSFMAAAPPELALSLYQEFIAEIRGQGIKVETGKFQAEMQVSLVNDGPVTLLIDSRKLF